MVVVVRAQERGWAAGVGAHELDLVDRRAHRFAVLGALLRRVIEIKSEDSEIALRHVFAIRYPERANDTAHNRELAARVNALVRRNLSADMCVKMLLKPLDLPARIQLSVHYPLAKITQHVFFR